MAKQDAQKKTVKKQAVKVRKKVVRNVPSGIVFVKATFNNTIISITDLAGNVLSWASAGKVNFSGSRKSSAYAATLAAPLPASRCRPTWPALIPTATSFM